MPEALPLTQKVRYHARWLLSAASEPIEQGTVITKGDRITWVGPTAKAPRGGRDEPLGEAILTPGLVNAHTHLDLTMMRGQLEGLPFFEWIRTVATLQREVLTDEDRLDASLLGVAEGLANGITCFADTSPSDAPFEALRALGARGIAYREIFGPHPAQRDTALMRIQALVESMRVDETPLVRVGVSPHAPYSVSDALFRAVDEWAREELLPVAVHLAESAEETALIVRGEGKFAEHLRARGITVEPRAASLIALVEGQGLLRRDVLLIHCCTVGKDEVDRVAAAGCGIAHCPISNAFFGHAIAPVADLLAAGARVGLGSDSMGSNEGMDLFIEARLATKLQSGRRDRATLFTPSAILRLLTLGGAEALGLEHLVGSLEVGKQADLCVFEAPASRPIPDPFAALLGDVVPVRATRVVVAGRELLNEGRVVGLDPAVRLRVQGATARVAEWRSRHTGD